jgi:hypothetical protein
MSLVRSMEPSTVESAAKDSSAKQQRPVGWLAALKAAATGAVITFSLTHNPLFQAFIIPGIITLIIGPCIGGMQAANKAQLRGLQLLVVSLIIGTTVGTPIFVATILLRLFLPAMGVTSIPEHALTWVGFFALGLAGYAFVTSMGGAIYVTRRLERK